MELIIFKKHIFGFFLGLFTASLNCLDLAGAKNKNSPLISYTLEPHHMDCLLRLSGNRRKNIISRDPLIAYDILNYTIPLIFAAYDLANNGLFKIGYLALLPTVPKIELDYMINNIKNWDNLRPEDQKLLENPEDALYRALKYEDKLFDRSEDYKDGREYVSSEYIITHYIDKSTSDIISLVVEKPYLIDRLAAQGFNVNVREKVPLCEGCSLYTPLESAVMLNNLRSAELLLKYGADFNIPTVLDWEGKKSLIDYVRENEYVSPELKKVFEEFALIGA